MRGTTFDQGQSELCSFGGLDWQTTRIVTASVLIAIYCTLRFLPTFLPIKASFLPTSAIVEETIVNPGAQLNSFIYKTVTTSVVFLVYIDQVSAFGIP